MVESAATLEEAFTFTNMSHYECQRKEIKQILSFSENPQQSPVMRADCDYSIGPDSNKSNSKHKSQTSRTQTNILEYIFNIR